jgi:hypothetical protein
MHGCRLGSLLNWTHVNPHHQINFQSAMNRTADSSNKCSIDINQNSSGRGTFSAKIVTILFLMGTVNAHAYNRCTKSTDPV